VEEIKGRSGANRGHANQSFVDPMTPTAPTKAIAWRMNRFAGMVNGNRGRASASGVCDPRHRPVLQGMTVFEYGGHPISGLWRGIRNADALSTPLWLLVWKFVVR